MRQSDAIKYARKKVGFSQKQLAQATGLSIATIQGYEQGKYYPKIENLTKIANALKTPLSDLVDSGTLGIMDSVVNLFAGQPPIELFLTPEEETLQANLNFAFNALNILGKRKLSDYAQDLIEIKKYTDPDTPEPNQDQAPNINKSEKL